MRNSTSKICNSGQCKKHPRHRQSPGVCSLCLGEKLTKVSTRDRDCYMSLRAKAYYYNFSSSISSSDDDKSSYPSSSASPRNEEIVGHRRILSDVVNMKSQIIGSSITKSKSMVSSSNEQGAKLREEKKKINGFWTKLIRSMRNDQKRVKNADLSDDNAVDQHIKKKVLVLSQSMPLAASSSSMVTPPGSENFLKESRNFYSNF